MSELHDGLFKDLVESTNFKTKRSVRSALNIIWMLENTSNLPKKVQEYLDKLKLKEKQFTEKNTRKVSGIFCKILNNESLFIKRFDFLVSKIESIKPYSLAIVDLKSIPILKHSIEYGLDINSEINNTYLLKHALDTKNTIIFDYLYHLPHIDKFKIDNEGNNIAHIMSLKKNYQMIYQLAQDHIKLFYVKNNDNKTAIDIIFNYKQYTKLPNKNRIAIKEAILMFLHLHHTCNNILLKETFEVIEKSTVLKDILIESNYIKLNNLLVNKEKSQNKSKVNKI